ncbi:hypothetical protein FWK35_00013121 [Aphis craccivora]|uniref:Uncharacterized protein n=1 Tax=Aphis craccivora TaxID=307492 RepID=A0A6G0YYI1_APHCR|nr:hypothetical protein FWK35_00013121 [Aphis craccivora]
MGVILPNVKSIVFIISFGVPQGGACLLYYFLSSLTALIKHYNIVKLYFSQTTSNFLCK